MPSWRRILSLTVNVLRSSDDYLGKFFSGLGDGEADLDNDGKVTFIEAHWYAGVLLQDHQIPYDSLDTLVDAFWQSKADALPAEISFSGLLELAEKVRVQRRAMGRARIQRARALRHPDYRDARTRNQSRCASERDRSDRSLISPAQCNDGFRVPAGIVVIGAASCLALTSCPNAGK
jgi:hypothetical protein